VRNFIAIGQGVFVWRVPEKHMFPQKSEVVFNIVLSAAALTRDWGKLQDSMPFVEIAQRVPVSLKNPVSALVGVLCPLKSNSVV
jgi:hypothetical protein